MKTKNIIIICISMLLFLPLFLIQCSGVNVRLHSVNDWIEGKPFPVTVTFDNIEKISEVNIHYSFNSGEITDAAMGKLGRDYEYLIPGNEVVAGKLKYYVSFFYEDKEKMSRTVTVKILTKLEAKEKLERELYDRLKHNPPKEVAVNKGVKLKLYVSNYKHSTNVVFYYKTKSQNSYRSETISGDNGIYEAALSKSKIEQGYNTYYFEVTEDDEDVGTLKTTLPYNGDSNPFSFKILSIEDLKDRMKDEFYSSISHSAVEKAYEIYDLDLNLYVNYDPSSFIGQLTKNKLKARVFYGKNGSSYKSAEMNSYKGSSFIFTLSSDYIKNGYNSYYFELEDDFEDVGKIRLSYRLNGEDNPFVYDIITVNELRYQMEDELMRSITHTPPEKASEFDELEITLSVNYESNMLINNLSKDRIRIKIAYGEYGYSQSLRYGNMNRDSDNTFSYTISTDELKRGYNAYYFEIEDDTEKVGQIKINYPVNGWSSPFTYQIVGLDEIIDKYENDLLERIFHDRIYTADATKDIPLKLSVRNSLKNTSVQTYIRRPGDNNYTTLNVNREGDVFESILTKEKQREGYTNYYFKVSEYYGQDIGTIEIIFNDNGDDFEYSLDTTGIVQELKEDLKGKIEHDLITEAQEGQDLVLTLSIDDMVANTEVYIYYRRENDSSFIKEDVHRSGSIFTATIRRDKIRQDYNQYYFEVIEPNSTVGSIKVTVPDGGPSDPQTFKILDLSDMIYSGVEFMLLHNVEVGTPVPVNIKLNYMPGTTSVFFWHRIAGTNTNFVAIDMNKNGNSFYCNVTDAFLQPGNSVDYYFEIIYAPENLSVEYPGRTIKSYSFKVKEPDNDEDNNQDENEENVFGSTQPSDSNTFVGNIYQLPTNTKKLPDSVDDLPELGTLYTRKIDIPERSFTEGFPNVENVFEWFMIRYTGQIYIRNAGKYTFRVLSDDGSILYIDNDKIINNDGQHSPKSKSHQIHLDSGYHSIRLDYFQGPRTQIALQLFVKAPNQNEEILDLEDYE